MHLFGILLLFGCHSNPGKSLHGKADSLAADSTAYTTANNPDTAVKRDTTIKHDPIIKNRAPLFDNHKPYSILSIKSTLERNTTDPDTTKCDAWKLSKVAVLRIINNSEPIDGIVWDLSYAVLSCTKTVSVAQSGQKFAIEINAGSFFSVW